MNISRKVAYSLTLIIACCLVVWSELGLYLDFVWLVVMHCGYNCGYGCTSVHCHWVIEENLQQEKVLIPDTAF